MAYAYDDEARNAARELRIRIERDLAAGRFLTNDADVDAATRSETVRTVRERPRSQRRSPWSLARRA
jgi:hypothetical protein